MDHRKSRLTRSIHVNWRFCSSKRPILPKLKVPCGPQGQGDDATITCPERCFSFPVKPYGLFGARGSARWKIRSSRWLLLDGQNPTKGTVGSASLICHSKRLPNHGVLVSTISTGCHRILSINVRKRWLMCWHLIRWSTFLLKKLRVDFQDFSASGIKVSWL